MNIIKQGLQYLVGFFFLVMSLSYFELGGKSIIGATLSFISFLIITPFSRRRIEKKFNFKFGKIIKYLTFIFGFIAPSFFVEMNRSYDNQKNTISDSISIKIDSIANDSLEPINKIDSNSIKKIATSNSVFSENKNVINKLESKRNSNYQTSSKNRVSKKSKNTSTHYSGSGYCGHPNKKGGNCRRRVKGGGYCWQHS